MAATRVMPVGELAEYIIAKASVYGNTPSNYELQGILYLIQHHYLHEYGHGIFNEDIYATKFGPCIKPVYYMYCHFGTTGIMFFDKKCDAILERAPPPEINKNELDEMIKRYSQYDILDFRKLIQFPGGAYKNALAESDRSEAVIFTEDIKNEPRIPDIEPNHDDAPADDDIAPKRVNLAKPALNKTANTMPQINNCYIDPDLIAYITYCLANYRPYEWRKDIE